MPVPSAWSDYSTTAASNSPAGTEDRTTADDYLREHAARLRKLYDGETAGQIQFPATQNASSGANVLDDYEEGTWTPTVAAATGSITSYSASGKYTKIGCRVLCDITVTITNKGTAAGTMTVSLPFSGSGVSAGSGVEIVSTGKGLFGYSTGSGSTWFLNNGTNNGSTPFVANGDQFILTYSFTV